MKVYLDNGSTTRVANEVLEAMLPYFVEEIGHPIFIYSLGQAAADAVERSQKIIAKTLNANQEEIVFTSGATESNDIAIRGTAYANKKSGNHIITTKVENPSVLRTCERLEKEGFKVDYLNVDPQGFVNVEQLEGKINENTILVSVAHVNDEIGTIEPIEEIGKILDEQKHKIYFHVNAAASYARVPLDVKRMKIDLLSISAHKIHGPKGVGALYVREGTKIEPINYGYISLFPLRPGTENVPGIVGFAKAAELAFDNFDAQVEIEVVPHIKRLNGKIGKQIIVTVRPEGGLTVTPTQIKMGSDGGKAFIVINAKHRAKYALTLEADYGTGKTILNLPVIANVERETLTKHLQRIERAKWHGNFKRRLPFAVAVFSSLLPQQPSKSAQAITRRLAVANVDCDERPDAVLDADGKPIPFLWRDKKLLLPVKQEGDLGIATGLAYFDGDARAPETLIKFERTDRLVKFAFPAYLVQFDAFSGAVTGIKLSEDERDIIANAHIVLTHSHRRWQKRQDASHIANSVEASANIVEGCFKAKGIIGDEDESIEYTQIYTLLPDRIEVSITIRNPQSIPLRIGEVAYEILRRPTKTVVEKEQKSVVVVEAENRPPQLLHAEFRDVSEADGSGFGLLLLHCQYRWGESFAGFRSGIRRTTISLGRNIVLDPNETISAKLDIIPHAISVDASVIAPTECVSIVGRMQARQ